MVFVEDVRHNEGPAINLAGPFCFGILLGIINLIFAEAEQR